VKIQKNVLTNCFLSFGRSTTKFIKLLILILNCENFELYLNIEPVVDFSVNGIVFVTNFSWSSSFLYGLGFSRSTILVCSTNINSVVSSEFAISNKISNVILKKNRENLIRIQTIIKYLE
jgi:hypothetical protein